MDFSKLLHYGPYVWGAYGIFALALLVELWTLRAGRRAARARLDEARLLAQLARREQRDPGTAPGPA